MDVTSILFFFAGLLVGIFVATLFHRQKQRSLEKLDELRRQDRTEAENTFATLSLDALTKNTEAFLNLAKERLSAQTAVGEESSIKRSNSSTPASTPWRRASRHSMRKLSS